MNQKLGEICVEEEFVSQDDVTYALLCQDEKKETGERKLLGQLLIEEEKLTPRELILALKKQQKVILVCSKCNAQFNVINKQAGRNYSCLLCGGTLQFPRVAIGTEVRGEIQGDLVRKSSKKTEMVQNLGVSVLAAYEFEGQGEAQNAEKMPKYNIQREIARGGMGVIYAAIDNDLKREIALKFLKEGPFASVLEKERFIQEFQITAGLQHSNIIPVYEVGKNAGELYYSMKLIPGETLRKILDGRLNKANFYLKNYRKGKLLRIFLSVCNGIGYAHSKRVIHRDLKPENVMVGDFGEVVVMDWGLSQFFTHKTKTVHYQSWSEFKEILEKAESENSLEHAEFSGTPSYMPPEQISGVVEMLDQRSDIFSLGVLLYEILTLKLPGKATSFTEILKEQSEASFLPPHKIMRGIPKKLSLLCMKAIAKNPADRFFCVQELIEAIEETMEKKASFFKS